MRQLKMHKVCPVKSIGNELFYFKAKFTLDSSLIVVVRRNVDEKKLITDPIFSFSMCVSLSNKVVTWILLVHESTNTIILCKSMIDIFNSQKISSVVFNPSIDIMIDPLWRLINATDDEFTYLKRTNYHHGSRVILIVHW